MVGIAACKMLDVGRAQVEMERFVQRHSRERGAAMVYFIFTKWRNGALHKVMRKMCVHFEEEVRGALHDHRRGCYRDMRMRCWMLATYMLARLKMLGEHQAFAAWR